MRVSNSEQVDLASKGSCYMQGLTLGKNKSHLPSGGDVWVKSTCNFPLPRKCDYDSYCCWSHLWLYWPRCQALWLVSGVNRVVSMWLVNQINLFNYHKGVSCILLFWLGTVKKLCDKFSCWPCLPRQSFITTLLSFNNKKVTVMTYLSSKLPMKFITPFHKYVNAIMLLQNTICASN